MKIQYMMLSIAGLLISGIADADPPHAITYEKKTANPGTTLNISGSPFTIIRLPIRDFTGNKFIITLPVPSQGGLVNFANVHTSHSTGPIAANMQIDGYDALVRVSDSRSYFLQSDPLNPGHNTFTVQGLASATVRIQVGTMVVNLSQFFESSDPLTGTPPDTVVDIGASYNAVSFAEWWKWTDPVTQVNALDNWIDYIRIFAL